MSNMAATLKDMLTRSVKFIGRNARRLAKETKYKTNELSDLGKRRDLIRDLGERVYKLSQNGLVLPTEATELIQQIAMLDSNLAVMRADHAAQKAADAQLRATEKAARAAEKAAAKSAEVIAQSTAPVEIDLPKSEAPVSAAPEAPVLEVPDEAEGKQEETEIPTLNI